MQAQNYCGTEPMMSESLKEYLRLNSSQLALRGEDTLYIKTVFHIVGLSNGAGYASMDRIFQQACETNEVYSQFGVVFYIADIRYINNSTYYKHTYREGREMMNKYRVPGAVNLFFVGDPAGNCGYYTSGADCIAISNSCLGEGSYTWAHEVGHYFSLPHTFLGWEGITYNYGQETPAFIGNRNQQTEKVDGSNCKVAADGFCDTPPDYLSYRWNCSPDSMSNTVEKDVNGEKFRSDGRYIMSYSTCPSIFSAEQQAAMRYNILQSRNLTVTKPDYIHIDSFKISGISPIMNEKVYFGNVTFSWDSVPGAIGYFLEYTPLDEFNVHSTRVYVEEPFYEPDTIYSSWQNIIWKVKPYGRWGNCNAHFSDVSNFLLKTTSTGGINFDDKLVVYPNPLTRGQILHLNAGIFSTGDVTVRVYDATGRLIKEVTEPGSTDEITLNSKSFHAGLYHIQLISRSSSASYKVIVVE